MIVSQSSPLRNGFLAYFYLTPLFPLYETDEAKETVERDAKKRGWEVQSYKLSEQSKYTIDLRKMEAALLWRKKFSCQREVVSCKIKSPRDICLCQYADVSSNSSLIYYFINSKISVVAIHRKISTLGVLAR